MSNQPYTSEESFITDTSSVHSDPTATDEHGSWEPGGQRSRPPPPPPSEPSPPRQPETWTPRAGEGQTGRRQTRGREAPPTNRRPARGPTHAQDVERKSLATQTDSEETKMSSCFVVLEKMARSQGSKLLRRMTSETSSLRRTSTASQPTEQQQQQQPDEDGQGCSYDVEKDREEASRSVSSSADHGHSGKTSRQAISFEGYWKLTTSDNWDAFLKEAGVGVLLRKISREMTTYERITRFEDCWHVEMISPLKNFESKFYMNEEFEEENFDGRKVKAIAYLNKSGTVMTIDQTAMEKDGLELRIIRRLLSSDEMLLTVTITSEFGYGTIAKRYFTRTLEET